MDDELVQFRLEGRLFAFLRTEWQNAKAKASPGEEEH
jgi:hypothetical protein